MDWNMVEDNWAHFQGKVKGRWGRLTGDRLLAIEGKRGQLVGKIQEVYGLTAEDAELQVQEFELRNSDYRPWTSSCSKWRAV
jgi:uncharacterized protein YjbJ (UPF0337 family)